MNGYWSPERTSYEDELDYFRGRVAAHRTTKCGIDLVPEEPGHYTCDEPADSRFPHHECGLHHTLDADCAIIAAMKFHDESMLRGAR